MGDRSKWWRCWCGRLYRNGKDCHWAKLHRQYHIEDGDLEPITLGGNSREDKRSWKEITKIVLGRDSHKCQVCGQEEVQLSKTTYYINGNPSKEGDYNRWKRLEEQGRLPENVHLYESGWSKSNLEVHHILARTHGGGNHPTNLITLCEDCHNKTKKRHVYSGNPVNPTGPLDAFILEEVPTDG